MPSHALDLPTADHRAITVSNEPQLLPDADRFADRHIGPREADIAAMLAELGYGSLDELTDATVPAKIRADQGEPALHIGKARSEHELLRVLGEIADKNQIFRSMIGMGYYDTITPPPILRHILENPLWYTPYTPYQAEIAQGRLEALLNFQTMVCDLTGLELANASLLDEATAAAEAMAMCHHIAREEKPVFYVADDCHPQTIAVLQTRADSLGITLLVGPVNAVDFAGGGAGGGADGGVSGILVQYPSTEGAVVDYSDLARKAHDSDALLVAATDLLSLTLLVPPGQWGGGGDSAADIVVGSSQRFGVPMGYGGPHAAFMATHEKFARKMPGRIVGVSKDRAGNVAYRLAIQTREQHIKRDRATSNICTAQVLLAVMAGMYAVYHGPEGLRNIAQRVHGHAASLAMGLKSHGHELSHDVFFDTLTVTPRGVSAQEVYDAAQRRGINLRRYDDGRLGISLDETTTGEDVAMVIAAFGRGEGENVGPGLPGQDERPTFGGCPGKPGPTIPAPFARSTDFLTHPIFNQYHSEHELLRYITRLQSKDISLAHSMIPLGSCTMKLNAAAEMIPITWPKFAGLHPYAPAEQAAGYAELLAMLEKWLADITGFAAVSLQPNAGSQGEYAGLLAIRAYHRSRGENNRTVCLIPTSAHGTNPASAVIAGYSVQPVQCDERGNVDVADLRAKAEQHKGDLGAFMITYPSTHGVFEESITEICRIVHEHGGQVYMDGANMNAQVGLCKPGDRRIGADVCHLNLHKTFCIPHGGGGPGMGPIAVAEHLIPFLPSAPFSGSAVGPGLPGRDERQSVRASPDLQAARHPLNAVGPVAAAPFGSPAILPIPWMYIALMGDAGLRRATQVAILNANYMAHRLKEHYHILYTGVHGRVAHEFILDCRPYEKSADVTVEDIAKRLIDFGFHAPTMSFPVPGTLMVEPTESESRQELDRFCDALIAIRQEITRIETGDLDRADNPLKNAPHTAREVTSDAWSHPYKRELAAYPVAWLRDHKYWPPVGRVDNAYGDRHLICACPPMEAYAASEPRT